MPEAYKIRKKVNKSNVEVTPSLLGLEELVEIGGSSI